MPLDPPPWRIISLAANVAAEVRGSKSHEHGISGNDVLMHPVLTAISTEVRFIKPSNNAIPVLQDHTDLQPFLSEIKCKPRYSGNTSWT